MKRSTMIQCLAVLAVCALLPATWAGEKNPVPRPFKMHAHSQMVLNLADGSYGATAWGQATHCGNCISVAWGEYGGAEYGIIIAANGDEISYENPVPGPYLITGGTGRFEGATGEFFIVSIEQTGEEIDPVAGTMILSFVWTASGTISY